MAFPLTHLCVAKRVLDIFEDKAHLRTHFIQTNFLADKRDDEAALFMLGSIAPDAVHYRTEYLGTTQTDIGPAKKITHLCPTSDEKWGKVTDDNGWIECVRKFLNNHQNNPLASGYAVHVLTDIFNHIGPWRAFTTKYPKEAAKGYNSDYYRDLKCIDLRLYNEYVKDSNIMQLLASATPQAITGLVSREELKAIQHNLLHVAYANAPKSVDTSNCFYITYDQTLELINKAAEFCAKFF